ncbi:cation diffusion facilitator family transporter [Candidatus Saccharibacteria bacterium]|nr:cation diffusion facilitator family transporter [Candidatus Saccharibacteria bacterium]
MEHSKTVVKAGAIAIIVNLLLAVFKIIIGSISNSVAVSSDALHGLVDTLSGVIVIVSEKIGSNKKLKADHEKIEHIGAIVIAMIIIIVGIHIIVESIEKIIEPEEIEYSWSIVVVLIASIIAKLLLGRFLKTTGKKVNSDTLIASSVETINDSIISGAVLVSILVYMIWHVNIEAYVSLIISFIVIKLGIELIFPKFFHYHHTK